MLCAKHSNTTESFVMYPAASWDLILYNITVLYIIFNTDFKVSGKNMGTILSTVNFLKPLVLVSELSVFY